MQRQEIDALGDRIAEIAVQLDVGTHALLTALRAFDEAGGWGRQGALTCSQWLSWRIGMGLGMARERVRIAQALGKLPLVDAAMGRGELSYSKVRAITRTATAATEAVLVEMARCSTAAQVEKICDLCRGVGIMPPTPSLPPRARLLDRRAGRGAPLSRSRRRRDSAVGSAGADGL